MSLPRKATAVFLALVGLLCVLYAGIWALVQTKQFRAWIENSARDAGIELRLERMALVFPFGLVLSSAEATLQNGFSFTSKEIRADVNPFALMFGQLNELTLVQPRVRVALTSASQGGEAPPINLLIRSFTVEDGRVEVETGDAETITIPRIELSGQNLNLGGQSGEMETVAFVPELNGEVKIALRATPAAIKARLELVQQQGTDTHQTLDTEGTRTSRGEITLHFEPAAALRLSGHVTLDQFVFSSVSYTGNLKLLAQTGANRETVSIDLRSETTHVAGFAPGQDLDKAFPLSTTITGSYATTDSQLTLAVVRVSSPLGTLIGNANLSLDKEPQLTNAVLEIRDIALARVQRLLPEAGRRTLRGIDGNFSAKLTMTGDLTQWSFSGIAETTATQMMGEGTKITQLKGKIPFALRAGHFEATGLRLDAETVDWRAPGQELKAGLISLGINGDIRHVAGDATSFNGTIDIRGGRFATDDGLSAAENIEGKASIQLLLQPGGLTRAQLDLKLNAMEFLWGQFFADFKPEQPSLNVSASYHSGTQTLQIERGYFGLRNIGNLELNGQLKNITTNPAFELRIATSQLRLSNFYAFFIRETFRTSHPLLGKLQLAGTLGADTVVRGGTANFSVEGIAQLKGTRITRPDHWMVGPVEVTLPFKIAYPTRSPLETAGIVPRAAVAVRRVTFSNSEIPPFTVFLSLWDNALKLLRPLQVPLYGGALIIERLAWQDLVAAPKNFSFSARIDDISLASITKDQGWRGFDGSLSGVIPQVRWADDTLRTDGALELRVFDGEIRLDEIEVTSLGGFLPAIKGNVDIRGIDLAKATKAFEFGSISGILAGSVEGLVISGGQPSQFRANIGTVPDKEVSQWISVEALNNITVLSSGAEGNALYGTLARFFKAYRYRKLGFKAQLRNDLLTLEGIKSQDGKEFLVEGSLIPPTVNVVSHTQRIGFKELMRRLERITRTEGSHAPAVQ